MTNNLSVTITGVGLETEQVVIENTSAVSVQMSGYRLLSVRGNQFYTFPNYLLEAGKSVTVYSGTMMVTLPNCMIQMRIWSVVFLNNQTPSEYIF